MSSAQTVVVGMVLGVLLAALVAAVAWMDYLAACDRQRGAPPPGTTRAARPVVGEHLDRAAAELRAAASLAEVAAAAPSVPADVIATVMVLQALEGLSDRDACRQLASREQAAVARPSRCRPDPERTRTSPSRAPGPR